MINMFKTIEHKMRPKRQEFVDLNEVKSVVVQKVNKQESPATSMASTAVTDSTPRSQSELDQFLMDFVKNNSLIRPSKLLLIEFKERGPSRAWSYIEI